MATRKVTRRSAPRITAWSFSRLLDWENCPLKAKLKHVDRKREPPNEAMERGSTIHKKGENYVRGTLKKFPPEFARFEEELKELRKQRKYVQTEQQLAVGAKWNKVDWFSKQAWLRVVIDALYVKGDYARAIDYKTGKVRASHEDQLDLYACIVFQLLPQVDTVDAELWYLDQEDDYVVLEYSRDELAGLKKKWEKRSAPMLADRSFPATPNSLCSWCFFSKTKGGPCQY